ncbi:MAG: 1-deoxy-D-xylulose-5-phosphate synthase [SAR324 cluster bacterium]|nr:1-deoxy-D-xylulose-5-phosphate synthase [SAR324 cluster bacterium]
MKTLLDNLTTPQEIQQFTIDELEQLAYECRQRIVEVTSKQGGHLASSLGALEITVALFKLFDFRFDRVVWDVGHQAYAHKLLTGRHKNFDSLTQKGGIKKFLSTQESPYDHFGAGHASTSISAALGMAIGRDLKNEKHHVIAIIGDGSLTGGLAFEALNHNGYLGKNLIIIINDNGISIDPNVGALSKVITNLTSSHPYNNFRNTVWEFTGKIPFSGIVRGGLHKFIASLKTFLTPGTLFEQLGWRYFGPVDGHNLHDLLEILSRAKELEGPIVIHVLTKKGKGYLFSEQDAYKYHGVTPFVPESGEFIKKATANTSEKSYTEIFAQKLDEIMAEDELVVAISAAMMSGTGIRGLQEKYPDRILDVGIAEGHAVTSAAGMATKGIKPFVTIYSTFLQRAFDHIIHDVALQQLPVKFMLDRAGLVGADGPTHHGVYDLTYLRMIPSMVIMVPKNGAELRLMIDFAYHYSQGPIALRYPRGSSDELDESLCAPIELGCSEIIKQGSDIAIFAVGTMVQNAIDVAQLLEEQGYMAAVINIRFVKPLDVNMVKKFASETKLVVSLEENSAIGGMGSAILECLSENKRYSG